MYKMLTTSLVLAFASLASAQTITTTVTVTQTSDGYDYTSSYTTTVTSPTSTSTATSTSSAPQATHSIQVGLNGSLTYTPNNIVANVGDTVEFFFSPKNHTVTQSTFANPCSKLTNGFNSGFVPTSVALNVSSFSFTVNNSEPIWGHCSQVKANSTETHCGDGMVFAVNAPLSGNTFNAFLAGALNSSGSVAPSGSSSATATGTAIGTATGTASGAASSSTSPGGSNSSSGISSTSVNVGLTAVLAVAGAVILAL